MIVKDNQISQAGHWYTRSGESAYTIVGKNGKERNTTLRDAREHNLVPSVTTILKCASSPGLEAWKQTQVLLSALTLPRAENEPEESWLQRVMTDSKETGRKAADRGTAIHAIVQSHYENKPSKDGYEFIRGTEKALDDTFGVQKWISEEAFAHELGFGGKCDLHSKAGIVVDLKTKEFEDPEKVQGYDEHLMQLSAYRMGFGMPDAKCANVFISVNKPGLVKVQVWSEEELQKGWKMFQALLTYWQVKNNYK